MQNLEYLKTWNIVGTYTTQAVITQLPFSLFPVSLQKDYKKQMLMAAHALAVDAKNLLDVIDQSRLKMITQPRPH